ncbi:unnamed protein product [Polarella glacialis]|uniref:Uncharacterized protein n=1 Tax=Polarella glacialis TaxID=89957 RepID=A0A813EG24_POLGL|nr:unnamed protein product [Polarella glacialis]CAE8648113.1 unnamed protein product [Polarella glacialis]
MAQSLGSGAHIQILCRNISAWLLHVQVDSTKFRAFGPRTSVIAGCGQFDLELRTCVAVDLIALPRSNCPKESLAMSLLCWDSWQSRKILEELVVVLASG